MAMVWNPGLCHPTGTDSASSRLLQERQHEMESRKGPARGGSSAGPGPCLPLPNSLPHSRSDCHFQRLPSHVMKERRMEVGEGFQLREGGSIYM